MTLLPFQRSGIPVPQVENQEREAVGNTDPRAHAVGGICYEYSGRENVGQQWHPAVLEIKKKARWSSNHGSRGFLGLPEQCRATDMLLTSPDVLHGMT